MLTNDRQIFMDCSDPLSSCFFVSFVVKNFFYFRR